MRNFSFRFSNKAHESYICTVFTLIIFVLAYALTMQAHASSSQEFSGPFPVPQTLTTEKNTPLAITLTVTHNYGIAFQYWIPNQPLNGTLTGTPPNLIYTPSLDYVGGDQFSFVINNGVGVSDQAIIHITVTDANQPPIIESEPVVNAQTLSLYQYDVEATDPDLDTLVYSLPLHPQGMTVDENTGLISWVPNAAQVGSHQIEVKVVDTALAEVHQTFNLHVSPKPNTAPVAQAQALSTVEDVSLAITLSGSDDDGNALTYILLSQPQQGILSGIAPNLVYTPNANFNGADEFTFKVNDGEMDSVAATISLTINSVNDAPVADTQALQTQEETTIDIILTGSDPENSALTYIIEIQPANGVLSGTAPNISYTPNLDFVGDDAFTFYVNDGELNSESVFVTIQVTGENDDPEFTSIPVTTAKENVLYTYDVNALDIDNASVLFSLSAAPSGMVIDELSGLIEWTPSFDDAGQYNVTVLVDDQSGGSATQSYTLTVENTNRAPVLATTSIITDEDVVFDELLAITDPDGDAISIALQIPPQKGLVSISGLRLNYQPNANVFGEDSFVLSISDGEASLSETVTVSIAAVNDNPIISGTPSPFVLLGEVYTYAPVITDIEQSEISFELISPPAGATLDAQTGEITWPTEGLTLGDYSFELKASDAEGGVSTQTINVSIISKDRQNTHEGNEFLFPVSINQDMRKGDIHLYLVSPEHDANVTLELAGAGIFENLSLVAGEITTHTIPLIDIPTLDNANQKFEDSAIHIVADQNIVVYGLNQRQYSTDGFVALPISNLGKQYIVGHYQANTATGISANGPIIGVTAVEDDTTVTIHPTMDFFENGENVTPQGEPFVFTLNAGDVFNFEALAAMKADFTGSIIEADKKIAVFGEHDCAYVPSDVSFCDHLVEQLPPIESLGTDYITAPISGRYGDRYRIVAPFDNTQISINGVLRANLDKQEYFEYVETEATRIHATHPVLVLQYSQGDHADSGHPEREMPARYADPFMVVVPPAHQYLRSYTVSTPAQNIEYNFLNVLIPTSAVTSVVLDGLAVDISEFTVINGSEYSYAQFDISVGAHTISADEAFGLYVYGFDLNDSYGYLGGMALSLPETVKSLELEAPSEQTLGQEACLTATAKDEFGRPINGVRAKFNIEGAAQKIAYAATNELGEAQYCYSGIYAGVDAIDVSVGSESASTSLLWNLPAEGINVAPVIISVPELSIVNGSDYQYQLDVVDVNNDVLSFELLNPVEGMSIDPQGLLTWSNANVENPVTVHVKVTDENQASAEQVFELSKYTVFNHAPTFDIAQPGETAIRGIPYVYAPDYLYSTPASAKRQIWHSDEDFDAVYATLLSGPQGASVVHPASPAVSGTNTIEWTPQALGLYDFKLSLRDVRGAVSQTQQFSVEVVENQAPEITSTPRTNAIVGEKYFYLVEFNNDVPLLPSLNQDNLQLVREVYPAGMSQRTVDANGTSRLFYIEWTPVSSQVGTHTIRIRLDDRVNSSEVQQFEITVLAASENSAPLVTSTDIREGEEQFVYEYQLEATDADGDALSYALDLAPQGMSISETGLITWLPELGDEGSHQVWVSIDDGRGGVTVHQYSIGIDEYRNRGPVIRKDYTPKSAKVGIELVHQVVAHDPENDPITYRIANNILGNPSIDNEGVLRWTPTRTGTYFFPIDVSDDQGNTSRISWNIQVVLANEALDAEVHLFPSLRIDPDELLTLTVLPENSASHVDVVATLDGVEVTLDENLQAQITSSEIGVHHVEAVVSDGYESVTRNAFFFVRDPSDSDAPEVAITSPDNNVDVTNVINVTATASDPNLFSWKLKLRSASSDDAILLAEDDFIEGTDATANASIDPTLLTNGMYLLTMEATDIGGLSSIITHVLNVEGSLKVGNLSFSLEDVSIPMGGMPLNITRSYDSRRKHESEDFGYGWSINYQDVTVEESMEPTKGWYHKMQRLPFKLEGGIVNILATCTLPIGPKKVSVTLPNDEVERFLVRATPVGGGLQHDVVKECYMLTSRHYVLEFEAEDGTRSMLTSNDGADLYLTDLDDGDLAEDIISTGPASISLYTLTTQAGYVYDLDQEFGIQKITDPNGNTLTYTENGIEHSNGKGLMFTRDSEGRIEQIEDPAGNTIVYNYDNNGDLESVTDAEGAKTSYVYNDEHALVDIIDPLGRPLVKNIYDDNGRLIAQEDENGDRTDFNHDIDGRLSLITDRNGNVTQHYYDDRGNILTTVDALGHSTSYVYDENDNQLETTNALGYSESATFDDKDNQLTATDALGNVTTFTYNDRGQEETIEDALGNLFTNTYDAQGNLEAIEDPLGNTASNAYLLRGLIDYTEDALGNRTYFSYDAEDRKAIETDAEGGVTRFTYDTSNNIETETRERTLADGSKVDEVTSYEYDKNNRLRKTIDALGNTNETEYDLAGFEAASIDALGRRTEMDYDAYGRLIETRYPDGTTENKTYDKEGNLLTDTDRNGNTTTYVYDKMNRQTEVHYADGSIVKTEYDAIGQVEFDIDALGNRTEHRYDEVGRRVLSIFPDLNEHQFEYDEVGNLVAEVDANNHRTEYSYNELDQRTTTTFHNNSVVEESFDALSRRETSTDQSNIVTAYGYDKVGRLTSVTDAYDNVTSFAYDETGNKISQTDAEGRVTKWEYDALGRVTKRILPLGQEESFTYDAVGNMLTHTDFNSDVTEYSYFEFNDWVERIDYADGTSEAFEYDNNGNRTKAVQTSALGEVRTTTYTYDVMNRLQSETQANGDVLEYTYDNAGNGQTVSLTRAGSTDVDSVTTYTYDNRNRLETVVSGTDTTTYTYDQVGNRESVTYPNGSKEVYHYDSLNRLQLKESFDGDGTLVQHFDYTLLPTGHRQKIEELSGRISEYEYDNLYRLTKETITDAIAGDHSAEYTYDKVGNRTYEIVNGVHTEYSYDDNDRLTQTGGTNYTHDSNGNTLTETLDSVTTSYRYNSKNKLVELDNDGDITSYFYNTDGIRTGQETDGINTLYIVDSNRDYAQVIFETDGANDVAYLYGDDLLSQKRGADTFFYHYDGLGSTRGLTDQAGSLISTYDYDAFGSVLHQTGDVENNYLFTGEQFDGGLGQYYLRARYYDQGIGRFTQMDTWMGRNSDPVTLHKYLYANANPVTYTDPTGNYGITSLLSGVRIQASLMTRSVSSVISVGRVKLLSGGSRSLMYSSAKTLRLLVKRCITTPKKCPIDITMVIIGQQHPNQMQHVADAIAGNGENIGGPIFPVLTYQSGKVNRKSWPGGARSPRGLKNSCNLGNDLNIAVARFGSAVDCDEFPFNASQQGGYRNYRAGRISLRYIPSGENQNFGSTMSGLARGKNKLKKGDKYVVVPAPFSPVSMTIKGRRKR